MQYIPMQIQELVQSVRSLPEQYRNGNSEDNAELTGRIAGLIAAFGIPISIGWDIGNEISNYLQFGQPARILTEIASSTAATIPFVAEYGHTAKNAFGDFARGAAETASNVKNSLDNIIAKYIRAK